MARRIAPAIEEDPLWYKDGVIYQLHVRSFHDSSGDGIGDFPGLTQKLDYLQDLGVTALWLLPFYPSPLRDDGYDIADYTAINPMYGSIRDFRQFLREARGRGIRVITELVINHTSDQHPWFQRSRLAAPGDPWRDFYVWSDTPEKYKDARIIFKDFETSNWAWDPVSKAYYWHRFYSHQPDLNFDNPRVQKAVLDALDFWMDMGVDGLRLDAIPYLYEREGTTGENLPETHEFLKKLRGHVDAKYRARMLLAEANQWPEDSRPYFGDGDECHVAFHFPLMPRLFMSVAMEDRFPIIDIMQQTPDIPENCQWALFLRNHDELTLEMVTDEDRDYMWRTYAKDPQARINLGIRRRLAPLLGNHRKRIELLNGLLFSFPGTPIIYYGDEIGMGDNIYLGDRNGVRTPMQWSSDRNAGFSRANPQRLYLPVIIDPEYHYEAINVEAQQNNTHSLLWWTKRLIDLRKRFRAFGRGTLEFLHPENRKVLVFIRKYEEQTILVVANLSRFVQAAELDLSRYRGMVPEELFGHTEFPAIGDLPYFVTLGPHDFYWFALQPSRAHELSVTEQSAPVVQAESLEEALQGRGRGALSTVLSRYIRGQRWFASKARDVRAVRLFDTISLTEQRAVIAILHVDYREGGSETYLLPLASGPLDRIPDGASLIARLKRSGDEEGVYEAVWDQAFALSLLNTIVKKKSIEAGDGEIQGVTTRAMRRGSVPARLPAAVLRAEQSNTSILYGGEFFLKLFRRIESGVSADFEITRFLTEETDFENTPQLLGALEYRRPKSEPSTIAILQRQVPNAADAWKFALNTLGRYFEAVASHDVARLKAQCPSVPLIELAAVPLTPTMTELLGPFIGPAEMLGRRVGELHAALASRTDDPAFRPEPFTPHYQRSVYQRMRTEAIHAMHLLRKRMRDLPESARADVDAIIAAEPEIQQRFRAIIEHRIGGKRIRLHGDLHLGQVLYTGKDFYIIDFEGEPLRPISERRIKRSALRDVAGMLRSFHYAAYAVLQGQAEGVSIRPEDAAAHRIGATLFYNWAGALFLRAYLAVATKGNFLPETFAEAQVLLDAFLLEKALYELGYELNNRPDWIQIPIRGMLEILGGKR